MEEMPEQEFSAAHRYARVATHIPMVRPQTLRIHWTRLNEAMRPCHNQTLSQYRLLLPGAALRGRRVEQGRTITIHVRLSHASPPIVGRCGDTYSARAMRPVGVTR